MGLTAQQAEEFRISVLREQKEARKPRVDEIVARSLAVDEVEVRLRTLIQTRPEERYFAVYVLDAVTNDWNDPTRRKIMADVHDELRKKYQDAFPDAEIEEGVPSAGNQGMAFRLTMRL